MHPFRFSRACFLSRSRLASTEGAGTLTPSSNYQMASSSSAAAAAASSVRPPDPAVSRRLIPDSEDDDGDIVLEPTSFPSVQQSRVVDQAAMARLACSSRGHACYDEVAVDLVTLNCRHVLCRPCFQNLRAVVPDGNSDEDDEDNVLAAVLPCPTCRTALPMHASATNHGLVGQVENLTVRCKHYPHCPAVYILGIGLRGETDHLTVCQWEPVPPCEDCGAPLVRGTEADHMATCAQRQEECRQCGELVPVATMAAHVEAGDWAGYCSGMVPCPNKCELGDMQPSSKSRRRNEQGDSSPEFGQLLRPCDVEEHMATTCPCRVVQCPFAACTSAHIFAHELDDHLGSKKHLAAHMQGMLTMGLAQQAAHLNRVAQMQAEIDALKRNPRMDPFPSYTRVYETVFRLPKSAVLKPDKFMWSQKFPAEHHVPDNVGVHRFQLDLFRDKHVPISKKHRRGPGVVQARGYKLAVEVLLCPIVDRDQPPIEPIVVRRQLGLSVKILRHFKDGDGIRVGEHCLDPGVYLDRFTAEFTNATNVQRHHFDAFEVNGLPAICDMEGALSQDADPSLMFHIELFEKNPLAAAAAEAAAAAAAVAE